MQNHALASDISDTLREHLGSPSVFGGVRVAHLFIFLRCGILLCLSWSYVLCTQCSLELQILIVTSVFSSVYIN